MDHSLRAHRPLSSERLPDTGTLLRIKTGRHTASQGTVGKIMRVIDAERRRLRSKKEKKGS
jgi:hypothetical protein